jgi:NitT/TauT family transport system substrate-binding protein
MSRKDASVAMNSASEMKPGSDIKLGRRAILAGGAATLALPAIAQGLTPVRYASIGGATDAGVFIGQSYGFFKDAGFDLKYQRLENAAALLAATATGQLDIAGISLTPGLLSSISQGIEIRVVGDKESIRKGFSATQLVARKPLADGGVAAVLARLKGKAIAISGRTSASYFLLGITAAKYGAALTDFRLVELSYPTMIPALASGAVDAAVMLEPSLSQALIAGDVVAVSDFTDVCPPAGSSIVPMVYSEAFAKDRAKGEAWMVAYMKAVRVYNDALEKGIDKAKVQQIVASGTGSPLAIIQTSNPCGFDPNQDVNAEFMQTAEQFFLAQRLLRAQVDVHHLLDPSFADHAVKVLGRYA